MVGAVFQFVGMTKIERLDVVMTHHAQNFRVFELLPYSTSQNDFLDASQRKIVGAVDRLLFFVLNKKEPLRKLPSGSLREDAMMLGHTQRLQGWLINR